MILIGIATLTTGVRASYAADPCETFFWTAAVQSPVERYKPRYLIGQGLEDVHMENIIGTRIRYKWSTQAASCIASSNHYGYFFHPDFNRTACLPGESCFPALRDKRMSERLTDVLSVAQQLATPNSDPTYQTNLNNARMSSYLVIDAMGAAPRTTASFYDSMVSQYDHVIDQLTLVSDLAFPPTVRTAVLDELCSTDNVARLTDLENQCFEEDQFCDLAFLFVTINMCAEYQNGAALDQILASVTTARTGLVTERNRLATERDQIQTLWNQIQALHPSFASLPPTCNIKYAFGTAQLPLSDFPGGHYGADLRFLYGGWQWSNFGVNSDTIKALVYVRDIANLVHTCVGDARYGHLDFRRRQVSNGAGGLRDETDKEYFERTLDHVVDVRRELADIERDYTALVHTNAPLIADGDISQLKTIASNTVIRMLELTANRTTGLGWILVLMQDFLDASDRFTEAQELTRALITVYLHQFPGVRDEVINQLIDNTNAVVDQYGQFFSEQKKADLEVLLAEAASQGGNDNLDQVIANLNGIADDLQIEFDTMWQVNEPLGIMASQLKFIFGRCASTPTPHPLVSQYFGDLPVATQIVQAGDDTQLCGL